MKKKINKTLSPIKNEMGSGPKCARCGKPISYGNLYCKACGGTGVRSKKH